MAGALSAHLSGFCSTQSERRRDLNDWSLLELQDFNNPRPQNIELEGLEMLEKHLRRVDLDQHDPLFLARGAYTGLPAKSSNQYRRLLVERHGPGFVLAARLPKLGGCSADRDRCRNGLRGHLLRGARRKGSQGRRTVKSPDNGLLRCGEGFDGGSPAKPAMIVSCLL